MVVPHRLSHPAAGTEQLLDGERMTRGVKLICGAGFDPQTHEPILESPKPVFDVEGQEITCETQMYPVLFCDWDHDGKREFIVFTIDPDGTNLRIYRDRNTHGGPELAFVGTVNLTEHFGVRAWSMTACQIRPGSVDLVLGGEDGYLSFLSGKAIQERRWL